MADDVGILIEDNMPKAENPSDINAAGGEIRGTGEHVPVNPSEAQDSQLPSHGSSVEDALRRFSDWKPPLFILKFLLVIGFIIVAPVAIALMLVLLSLPVEIIQWVDKESKIKGIYEKVFEYQSFGAKIQFLALANIIRLGCLALSWMVIALRVPSLRSETILGTVMWKWSLFAAVIFCGYPCVLLAAAFVIVVLSIIHDPFEDHDKAYFWEGLFSYVSWLLYCASVLIVWLAYFHTEHGLNKIPEIVDKYVTWTLVSCLVGAVLGVAKAVVVLHWKAKAIYRRFKPKILMAGFQLYFLCIIVNEFASHSLMPWRYREFLVSDDWKLIKDGRETHTSNDKKRRSIQDYFLSTRMSLPLLGGVADRVASLAQVLREDDGVAEVEQKCRENISNEGVASLAQVLGEDDGVAEVEQKCRENISNDGDEGISKEYIVNLFKKLLKDPIEYHQISKELPKDPAVEYHESPVTGIVRKVLVAAYYFETMVVSKLPFDEDDKKRKLENIAARKDKMLKGLLQHDRPAPRPPPMKTKMGDDFPHDFLNDGADLLLKEVKVQQSSDKITHEMLRKWMVDAHKDCLSLGYTLVDAFAVVNVLDWVLTWSIVAVVILFWLIVTGLATTKVLVAIVSPFLALTFMFGDTFKAFFQGAIFSFATHPFDVGDECFIDKEKLVVKNINILTTTFHKNKNNKIVLIPNSILATKRIDVRKLGTRTKTEAKGVSTKAEDSQGHESLVSAASC